MFTSMIIATAKNFTQGNVDKNGKAPVILNVLAGQCPNRTVISGTVAEREGLEVGKSYLIQVRETKTDTKHGRQFVFSKAGELSPMDILSAVTQLGNAEIFDITGATSDDEVRGVGVEIPEEEIEEA